MCGWVLSQRRIGPFLSTNAGCRYCSFQWILSVCWTYFSNAMVSQDSESCGGSDLQHTSKQGTWPFHGTSLTVEVHWSLLIPLASHVTIQPRSGSLLLHRIRDDASQWYFGPNVLMLWVVSAALQPILDSNKKITETCFLSNTISMF